MARPRKPIHYEEEIQRLDMQIVKWKNTIKELEEEKRKLLSEKQELELRTLYEAIQTSGISVQEAISLIDRDNRIENAG